MDWAEACRVLGVPESATEAEIKEQYIYKAQLLHPDKNQDKPENIRQKAEAELALVNQAYSFLSNPLNNPYKIPPKLAVEPVKIRFKDVNVGEHKTTTLIIRNIGGPYTSIWIDNHPAPWLTVIGVNSITRERLPLEVVLEGVGIGEPGRQYVCDLSIKLENESTHTVDQATVKIELYIKSKSQAPISGTEVIHPDPPPQPVLRKKAGFSFRAFLVNLLAFAVIGIVLVYLVRTFLKIDELIFIIALIIYSATAFGVSFNQGLSVGSKTKKSKT
jgi:hypothetical protein